MSGIDRIRRQVESLRAVLFEEFRLITLSVWSIIIVSIEGTSASVHASDLNQTQQSKHLGEKPK